MSPFVSIIIPTYNEAADISETLAALVMLDYEEFEVLVVDASHDATPEIVAHYPSDKIRLIRQSRGRGRAAARNEGLLLATGEIVIILNADVRLPRDFIKRLIPHYATGADYVLVESRVSNTEYATARYVQALHEKYYPPTAEAEARMNWTEGFSCRREAALAVGLIPEGTLTILVAGEDGWFGEKLAAAGYRKVFDHDLTVIHVMPPDLGGFWAQRVGRGEGTPQIWHGRDGWSLNKVLGQAFLLAGLSGLALMVPLPALWRSWQLSRLSPCGRADWPVFAALDWLETAANSLGLLQGALALRRANS